MVGSLPVDILTEEILLKLPAKPLLRFKSVCKGWRSIISSPSFVTKHFNRDTNLKKRALVLYSGGCKYRSMTKTFTHYSYFPDADAITASDSYHSTIVASHEVPDHLLLWGEITFLRGPFNGVFCIHSANNRFALWNPTTRRLRPIYCSPSFKFDEMGFGVDPLTGDLKIVLIFSLGCVSSSFAVYTSRNHSWKYLEQESLRDRSMVSICNSYSNAFLNGYYYWLKRDPLHYALTILAFDMHNEIFQVTEAPDIEGLALHGKFHLLNDDSLALVSMYTIGDSATIYIWLMEGKMQWNPFLSVSVPFKTLGIFGFWGGNKILLQICYENVREMIIYDFKSGYFKGLEIKKLPNDIVRDFIPIYYYKESLYAVNGEDGIEDYDTRSPEGLEVLGYQGRFTKIGCSIFRGEANLGRTDVDIRYYTDEERRDAIREYYRSRTR